ncbi:uncharacterized protein VTP21DRAFT_11272 [Calcarisporiella thermophila]|uniref:uncharacterized protein n=1 Tax=Calcarisporiella thermophila TaxID=911321 RepID=UPI003742DABA
MQLHVYSVWIVLTLLGLQAAAHPYSFDSGGNGLVRRADPPASSQGTPLQPKEEPKPSDNGTNPPDNGSKPDNKNPPDNGSKPPGTSIDPSPSQPSQPPDNGNKQPPNNGNKQSPDNNNSGGGKVEPPPETVNPPAVPSQPNTPNPSTLNPKNPGPTPTPDPVPSTSRGRGPRTSTSVVIVPPASSGALDQSQLRPSQSVQAMDAQPQQQDNSGGQLMTAGIAIGCVVVAAGIGIFIFRKWKLSPSNRFKDKMRGSDAGFGFTRSRKSNADFLRELQDP